MPPKLRKPPSKACPTPPAAPKLEAHYRPVPASVPKNMIADTLNSATLRKHRTSGSKDVRIHVSDLMKSSTSNVFCPREVAIAYHEPQNVHGSGLSPGMKLLFKYGNMLHDHVRDEFIYRSEYGHCVFGNWTCPCGSLDLRYQTYGQVSAINCATCGKPASVYKECDIYIRKYKIVGHPDLLLLWNNVLIIYEIKTLDRADIDFDGMLCALGDHRLQGTLYYWIMKDMFQNGELPYNVSSDVHYLYVDRNPQKLFFGPIYKEFVHERSAISRIIHLIEKAKLVADSCTPDATKLPPRICVTNDATRANACHCRTSCFSRETGDLHVRNVPRA